MESVSKAPPQKVAAKGRVWSPEEVAAMSPEQLEIAKAGGDPFEHLAAD